MYVVIVRICMSGNKLGQCPMPGALIQKPKSLLKWS